MMATPAKVDPAAVPPAAAAFFSAANRPKGQRDRSAKVVVSTSIGCDAVLEIVHHCALRTGFRVRSAIEHTAYFENETGLEVIAIVNPVGNTTRMVIMRTGSPLKDGRHPSIGSVRPLSDAVERTLRSIYPLATFAYVEG